GHRRALLRHPALSRAGRRRARRAGRRGRRPGDRVGEAGPATSPGADGPRAAVGAGRRRYARLAVTASAPPLMPPSRVAVIIPAFNEEGALPGVLAELRSVMAAAGVEADAVVIDDGSTDRTAAIAAAGGAV